VSDERRARLARMTQTSRLATWEWWREPKDAGHVACVSCGASVCTAGAEVEVPQYRSLPAIYRAGQGKRSQPTEGRSLLVVCPGCHELHEIQVRLKAA